VTLAVREIHVGDCRELLRQLPDDSIHCVVTSPPYWGLRDYGVDGQIGLEATPEEYVAVIVEIFREVRRVLRHDGTLWLNLGDCYATGAGKVGESPGGGKQGARWRVAFALQADGWYLRMDVVWSKPNPMPESVTDRPTRAHEFVFLLSKSADYFYDGDAIKEPVTGGAHHRGRGLNPKAVGKNEVSGDRRKDGFNERWRSKSNASYAAAMTGLVDTRNKRSVWTIASEPYGGAHFATFPTKLVTPCILAGCPADGIVLDPFGGSGTVGEVAEALGRRWILFELSETYADLARKRTAQRGLLVCS